MGEKGGRMAGRVARWVLTALVWSGIVGGLAVTIIPRFLDRIYYEGPASDHFDGARFSNPGADDTIAPPTGGSRAGFLWSMITGQRARGPWPDSVPVTPGLPDASLIPCPELTGGASVENWGRCHRGPMDAGAMSATWVGHATVLVQTAGFAMLTDPVWSDRAGPFGLGPKRVTPPGIRIGHLPKIDLIVVSHNHYDHLDLDTLKALWDRDQPVIVTALGNDALLASRGIPSVALDWGGTHRAGRATVHVTRNHHWSTRWATDRNRALWSSFVVDTPTGRVYFAGDTGFGDGEWTRAAAAIRAANGTVPPVRLALLPIGAFRFRPGQMHTTSHIGPEQAVTLWNRMGRPLTMAIHWGTFRLSDEGRDTPPAMLSSIMRCVGADPARFAPWPVGVARPVPAATAAGPSIDEVRIGRCGQQPDVLALP